MISENFLLNKKTDPVPQFYLIQMPCERTAASQPDPYIQKGFICRNKPFLKRGRQHRQDTVRLRSVDGIDRILDLLFILRNHHLPGNADSPVVPGQNRLYFSQIFLTVCKQEYFFMIFLRKSFISNSLLLTDKSYYFQKRK